MDYARNNGDFPQVNNSKVVVSEGDKSLDLFRRQGLEAYWGTMKGRDERRELLEETIFAMHENIQRTDTSASDLMTLDYKAESEYRMFPGEKITIAKGYLRVIESLAFVWLPGCVQLGRKVNKIEWQSEAEDGNDSNGYCCSKPVKLHFCDGSVISADHVIVTVFQMPMIKQVMCKYCRHTFSGLTSRIRKHIYQVKNKGVKICSEPPKDLKKVMIQRSGCKRGKRPKGEMWQHVTDLEGNRVGYNHCGLVKSTLYHALIPERSSKRKSTSSVHKVVNGFSWAGKPVTSNVKGPSHSTALGGLKGVTQSRRQQDELVFICDFSEA